MVLQSVGVTAEGLLLIAGAIYGFMLLWNGEAVRLGFIFFDGFAVFSSDHLQYLASTPITASVIGQFKPFEFMRRQTAILSSEIGVPRVKIKTVTI
jgi:hypothetical protein